MVAPVRVMRSKRKPSDSAAPAESRRDAVVHLPVARSEAALAVGLRASEPWAQAALYERYAPEALRILRRLVGHDPDVDERDLLQEVFVRALSSADQIDDAEAIGGWMRTITVRTAYRAIRHKRTRRWLHFWEPSKILAVPVRDVEPELRDVYRRAMRLLDRLPARDRIPFALRYVEEMRLADIAESCGTSVATVKRRIARARERFVRAARRDDVLCGWLEEEK